jgi:hypothetical protein
LPQRSKHSPVALRGNAREPRIVLNSQFSPLAINE